MPTENWYPLSTATASLPYDQWNNAGGANKNASTTVGGGRAGPATHDDDTTSIQEGAGINGLNRAQSVNVDWPGPIGAFTALSFSSRSRSSGGASTRTFKMSNAGGTLGGTIQSSADGTDTYVNLGATDISDGPTYRPGGGAWDPVDFANSITMFPYVIVTVSNNTIVTSIYGTLNYSPPSGGFAFLLQLAGLSALPFVGAMDFSQFVKYLSWRRAHHPRHTIMTGAEVRRAWRELREYKHPTFFFPRFA